MYVYQVPTSGRWKEGEDYSIRTYQMVDTSNLFTFCKLEALIKNRKYATFASPTLLCSQDIAF